MQVSVESTGTLGRKITVQVPSERINDAIDKKLNELSRTVKLDGFRPGKVPMKVVKQKFSGQVRQDVMGEVLQSTLYEAINQEELKPAQGPTVEDVKMEPGQPMEYVASFEVYPEVELSPMGDITVEKITSEVQDSDVDNMFEKLQTQRVTWEPAEREAADADQVIITFVGRIDGEEFAGGKTDQEFPLVLGSNSMIPGFEEKLIGVKAGDKKTIEVTFPDDYQGKEVAGKQAEFDVDVINVNKPILPEINDEFAKAFGIADGIETFRKEVRANMERELSTRLQSRTKATIMDALLDANELEIPTGLVNEEIETLKKQAMGENPEALKDVSLPNDLFEENAKRRVKLGLLVGEVIQANNLQVDKQKTNAKLAEIASTYEHPAEVINAYRDNPRLMQSLDGLVLEDQVVELLSQQVKTEEKPMKFDDIMNESAAQ